MPSAVHVRRSSLVLFAFLLGCGPGLPRAEVRAARPETRAPTPTPTSTSPVRRYRADPRRSRLEVHASSTFTGWSRITFGRWSARVVRGDVARVSVDVDMTTLQVNLPDPAESVIKNRLLEVHRFPHATLEGTIQGPVPDEGSITIEGIADLHGVRRAIRFVGTLARERDGERETYRFRAKFLLSRLDFDIGFHDAWDAFLGNDVKVFIDVAGVEEKVTVEELDPKREPDGPVRDGHDEKQRDDPGGPLPVSP